MENSSQVYGFRYRFGGRFYALDVSAKSRLEVEAKVVAIAKAEF